MKKILQIINENAQLVTAEMQKILESTDIDYQILFQSMNYSVQTGGKRIRPTLVLEFAAMLGGSKTEALPIAAAVEMVHTYSLIHDDLPCMDNDDMRRGEPTNHKVFGEANALLAGDALLTHAFYVLANNHNISPAQALRTVHILASKASINGMVGGQQLDMLGEGEKLTLPKLLKTHALKTGALIRASALLGCAAANGTDEDFYYANIYAENIGLAFQIIDDILDSGEESVKTTFLDFYTIDEAKNYAKNLTDIAIDAIKHYEKHENLRDIALFLLNRTT